jgi:hypothetical protein
VVTKKTLVMGLAADYLIVYSTLLSVLFIVGWNLKIIGVVNASWVYIAFVLFAVPAYCFGYIKTKADPEFVSVHLAKFQIPEPDNAKLLRRYLEEIEIEP